MKIPAKFEKYNLYFLGFILFLIPFNAYFIPFLTVLLAVGVLLQENRKINLIFSLKPIENKLFLGISISLFVLMHIGLMYSNETGEGLKQIKKQLALLLIPFLLLLFNKESLIKNRKNIFWLLSLSVIISTFWSYFQSFQQANQITEEGLSVFKLSPFTDMQYKSFWELVQLRSGYFTYGYLSQNFHPSYFALIINVVIGFIILEMEHFWRDKRFSIVLLIFVLFLYLSFFLYLLQSRASIITYFIIIALYTIKILYSVPRLRKVVTAISVLMIIAMVFVVQKSSLYNNIKEIAAFERTHSMEQIKDKRLLIWRSSANLLKDNWVWGLGTGEVKVALHNQMNIDKNPMYRPIHKYDPHNQFLAYWLALGIPGLFIFIAWLAIPFISAVKNKDFLLVLVIFNVLINLLFETMLNRSIGVIFISLIISFLLYSNNTISKSKLPV